jgi:hypothetical protein
LRVLPILFAALAVALVAWWALRLWGTLAGIVAALLIAVNPLFAFSSRSVRGYSLMTLCVVASSILCVRLLRREDRTSSVAYVIAAAAGIATHLFALVPFAAQVGVVAARGERTGRWAARFGSAFVLGGMAYVEIGPGMVDSAQDEAHHFRPRFPLTLAHALLGGTAIAVAATAVLFFLGIITLRRRELLVATGILVALFLLIWLVVQPFDLYPRFLVWLVAAVALVAAAAVARWRFTLPLVVAAVAALVVVDVRDWTENPLPDRQAALLIRDARALGDRVCVLPLVRGSLLAYTRAPREVTSARNFARCDVVVGTLADSRTLLFAARRDFSHDWTLTAETPYFVYSRTSRMELNPTAASPRSPS